MNPSLYQNRAARSSSLPRSLEEDLHHRGDDDGRKLVEAASRDWAHVLRLDRDVSGRNYFDSGRGLDHSICAPASPAGPLGPMLP